MQPKLLLFDIDGTLIHSGGAGKVAMERAFEKVYGRSKALEGMSLMGRMDSAILQEALAHQGLPWKEEEAERFKESYYGFLEEELKKPRHGKGLCPGIQELLLKLRMRNHVTLGVLTGNWRKGGEIKLRYFGIKDFFELGVFAEDGLRREDLLPVAMARYVALRGEEIPKEHVYVIGDTLLDIQSAKPHGVRTVAVATGIHTLEELQKENPDYLFPDFSDTEKVLSLWS